MRTKWTDFIGRLMEPINPALSGLMGILTLFWGLWVVCPAWDAFSRAALYDKMSEFAPEWAWGTWSVTAGSILIITSWKHNYVNVCRALAFIAWHWFTVSTLMWFGDWQNTGPLTYSLITSYAVFFYLNIKLNYVGISSNNRVSRFLLRAIHYRRR